MNTTTTIFVYDRDKIEVLNGGLNHPAYIRINGGEFYLYFTRLTQMEHLLGNLASIIDGIKFRMSSLNGKEETNAEVKE